MEQPVPRVHDDDVRAFVEELLRTGLTLTAAKQARPG